MNKTIIFLCFAAGLLLAALLYVSWADGSSRMLLTYEKYGGNAFIKMFGKWLQYGEVQCSPGVKFNLVMKDQTVETNMEELCGLLIKLKERK